MSTPLPSPETKSLVIGISGPSSSGKTSLARLLRDVFDDIESLDSDEGVEGEKNGDKKGEIRVKVTVMHQDDFYVADEEIPMTTIPSTNERVQDWDSAEAIDWPRLRNTLDQVVKSSPVVFKEATAAGRDDEDEDEDEEVKNLDDPAVPAGTVAGFRRDIISRVRLHRRQRRQRRQCRSRSPSPSSSRPDHAQFTPLRQLSPNATRTTTSSSSSSSQQQTTLPPSSPPLNLHIIILEGFLLYPPPPPPPPPRTPSPSTPPTISHISPSSPPSPPSSPLLNPSLFHLRLFLPLPHSLLLSRRIARSGYDTSGGVFWVDPPGYVEEVVWRNYRRDMGWLFREENGGEGEGEREREMGEWVGDGGRILCAPGQGEGGLDRLLGWAVERVWEVIGGGSSLISN